MPPHRIGRKHHYVTTTNRHVNHRRTIRQFITTRQHSADKQVLFVVRKSQHNTRPQLRRHKERTLTLLLIVTTAFRTIGRARLRHGLNHIRIADTAASRSARRTATPLPASTAAKTPAAARRDLKQRRLVEVDRQSSIVTVSNRTLAICKCRVVDRAARLKPFRLLNRNTVRDAVVNRNLRDAPDRNEQSAIFDKLLKIGDAGNTHPTTHVISLIRRVPKIRSYI